MPSEIYPNLDFGFANKPSGNPAPPLGFFPTPLSGHHHESNDGRENQGDQIG
jgi:hypothetical protein